MKRIVDKCCSISRSCSKGTSAPSTSAKWVSAKVLYRARGLPGAKMSDMCMKYFSPGEARLLILWGRCRHESWSYGVRSQVGMGKCELKAHVRFSTVLSAPTDSGLLMHVCRINALTK